MPINLVHKSKADDQAMEANLRCKREPVNHECVLSSSNYHFYITDLQTNFKYHVELAYDRAKQPAYTVVKRLDGLKIYGVDCNKAPALYARLVKIARSELKIK